MSDWLHSLWSQVVFAYDFDSLTPGGLLRDFGPLGLAATFPGGGAAPTRQLDGSYSFDGGDYLSLSGDAQARFYANSPTGTHTWLVIHGSQPVTGIAPRLFSCENGNFGIATATVTTTNPGNVWAVNNSGAAIRYSQGPAGCLPLTPKTSWIYTMETTPRLMINSAVLVPTWAAGAYGAPAYDATTVPRIGMQPSGGGACAARLYYLALLRGVPTTPEMLELNRMFRDGGKVWCNRG